jgi:hypothetical protein
MHTKIAVFDDRMKKGDGLRILSFQSPKEAGDGEGYWFSSAEREGYSYPMGRA